MQASTFFSSLKSDSEFDDQAAALEDTRAYPNEAQLLQLGTAIMTELLDCIGDGGGTKDSIASLEASIGHVRLLAQGETRRNAPRALA